MFYDPWWVHSHANFVMKQTFFRTVVHSNIHCIRTSYQSCSIAIHVGTTGQPDNNCVPKQKYWGHKITKPRSLNITIKGLTVCWTLFPDVAVDWPHLPVRPTHFPCIETRSISNHLWHNDLLWRTCSNLLVWLLCLWDKHFLSALGARIPRIW